MFGSFHVLFVGLYREHGWCIYVDVWTGPMVLSSNWFSRYNSYLRTVFLRQFSISDLYKILMFPVILRKFFFLLIFDNLRTLFQLRKFWKLFFLEPILCKLLLISFKI